MPQAAHSGIRSMRFQTEAAPHTNKTRMPPAHHNQNREACKPGQGAPVPTANKSGEGTLDPSQPQAAPHARLLTALSNEESQAALALDELNTGRRAFQRRREAARRAAKRKRAPLTKSTPPLQTHSPMLQLLIRLSIPRQQRMKPSSGSGMQSYLSGSMRPSPPGSAGKATILPPHTP